MSDNKNNTTLNNQPTITIPTETLVQIYNILYSIEAKGGAVKSIAFIEQILEEYLNPQLDKSEVD